MANESYHEPIHELSDDTRDMLRAITSLMEELEAIDWYNQRVDACKETDLTALLAHNRDEENEHEAMVLEWILRRDSTFDAELKDFLFTDKPITHKYFGPRTTQLSRHSLHVSTRASGRNVRCEPEFALIIRLPTI